MCAFVCVLSIACVDRVVVIATFVAAVDSFSSLQFMMPKLLFSWVESEPCALL